MAHGFPNPKKNHLPNLACSFHIHSRCLYLVSLFIHLTFIESSLNVRHCAKYLRRQRSGSAFKELGVSRKEKCTQRRATRLYVCRGRKKNVQRQQSTREGACMPILRRFSVSNTYT